MDIAKVLDFTSPGERMALLLVAIAKRVLQWKMPPDLRLTYLELINKQTNVLTPEMITMIEPFCERAQQIIDASGALESRNGDFKSWNILESRHVFGLLLRLNPSILAAIRHRAAKNAQAAAAFSDYRAVSDDLRPAHMRVEMPAAQPWSEPSEPAPQFSERLHEIWDRKEREQQRASNRNIDIFTGGAL